MLLKVLSIAFPSATVGPHAMGDVEQVLGCLDRALIAGGHTSVVVACEGSQTAGRLFSFPLPAGAADHRATRIDSAAVQAAIDRALAMHDFDLVHLHGIDLHRYRLPADLPVLITLHLPVVCYSPQVWSSYNGRAQFCCVSPSQQRTVPAGVRNCTVIENGGPLPPVPRWPKGDFAVTLARICSEENTHDAFEAGTRAGTRVLLGGEVVPHPEHLQYFHNQIEPRVRCIPGGSPQHAFLGRLQQHHKQALLGRAKCLLHPSRAPQASSLVAMQALAAGTPVIAYRSAALTEIVDDGVTGFLVENVAEMAESLGRVHQLSPRACREIARRRFSDQQMTRKYFNLYRAIARREQPEALCA